MKDYPNRIRINGHEYHQQYRIEGGMYYQTDDSDVSFIFASFVAMYDDGKITYLLNGIEREWENVNIEIE